MKKVLFFLILMLFLSTAASASFEVNKNSSSIINNYNAGEFVKGKINISFSNQLGSSVFISSFGGEKRLSEVLNASGYSKGKDFSCSPADCGKRYETTNPSGSESVQFNLNQNKVFGFKVKDVNVNFPARPQGIFDFYIGSNAQAHCKNQLYVDLFADDKIDFYNDNYLDLPCGEEVRGCFDNSAGSIEIELGAEFTCEKMTLPPAPAYRVGANLIVSDDASGTMVVSLFSLNKSFLCGGTSVSQATISEPSDGKVSEVIPCGVIEETPALVCVHFSQVSSGSYKIKAESDENSCGAKVVGTTPVYNEFDFDLFAQPLAYDDLGTQLFSEVFAKTNGGLSLEAAVDNYIKNKFNRSCTDGCIIPISIKKGGSSTPGQEQIITIDQITAKYRFGTSVLTTTNHEIYPVTETDFKISSPFIFLDVEKMEFATPNVNGTRSLKITLDDEEVISKEINIRKGFNFDIAPKFTLIGKREEFFVSEASNISSTKWNFGDGKSDSIVSSNSAFASHAYSTEGVYNVEVEVKQTTGIVSFKRFKVAVGDPKISLNVLTNEGLQKITNLEEDMKTFPEWVRTYAKTVLGVEGSKANLTAIKSRYTSFTSEVNDSEYIKLIEEVLKYDLPDKIYVSGNGKLPGELSFEKMNPSYVAAINQETVSNKEATKEAIRLWMSQNYESDIGYDSISTRRGSEEGILFRKYKIDITNVGENYNGGYLVVGYPFNSVKPAPNSEIKDIGGSAFYLTITNDIKSLDFLTIGATQPEIEDLGVYISPALSELSIVEIDPTVDPENLNFPWKFFFTWLAVLLVAVLIVYLLMQGWYKRYYERKLFKNPADLYNLVNFIYNSRKAGLDEKEIKIKLKNTSWKGEQIVYAFKKIDGQRTGMWEIPIFKFAENMKVRKEIQSRQGGRVPDARFIKRPF